MDITTVNSRIVQSDSFVNDAGTSHIVLVGIDTGIPAEDGGPWGELLHMN